MVGSMAGEARQTPPRSDDCRLYFDPRPCPLFLKLQAMPSRIGQSDVTHRTCVLAVVGSAANGVG
jgi:hypothetical protein